MDKLHDWPDASSLRAPVRKQLESALDFLMSARCFLHFRHGRDDNTLSWEAQDEAAARRVGTQIGEKTSASDGEPLSAADWMRIYFGHARAVQRTVTQLLEEIPEAWSALYRQVQSWRSRLTSADFSVVDGLIFLQQPSAMQDPEVLLRLFHFMAHHGLKLSATTEYRIEQALPALASTPPRGAEFWLYLQETCCSRTLPTLCVRCIPCACSPSVAGAEAHRLARGPRFLSSLHGGRTFLSRHREPASPQAVAVGVG